ncbi:Oidioi.mRNA.OKI2018_I69.chr1.g2298.t1.cds [Oikopleura dioica]|uniref:Oidioi.mRNA.OKI2018_I69.chr1.g2298.t1.cds n=1 Tax=Oikopleura dioica TaxID=34765 RepID=A0ABN7SU77_OIKDI|nr:Oidioi.mRNA.OKI2018_I69.chr1.g2298.t1.cds [Oikopleura dioica]
MEESIDREFVVSWGNGGNCCACRRVTERISIGSYGDYFCEICSANERIIRSYVHTAVFKCPENSCNSRLSFREHLLRRCCNAAMRKANASISADDIAQQEEFKKLKNQMDLLQTAKEEEKAAKRKMDETKKAFDDATAEYTKKNTNREKIENELAASFSEAAISLQNKEKQEDRRFFCNVCFEKYDGEDRLQCVLQCGHPSCHKCLTTLPEKLCPICRKPFQDENIIKLFYN